MANTKLLIALAPTGKTVYIMVKQELTGHYLENTGGSAGTFVASPSSPYVPMSEDGTIKQKYNLSESRSVWADGPYSGFVYQQLGGSPAPTTDIVVTNGQIQILSDLPVTPT
jgi:hypothetical protein